MANKNCEQCNVLMKNVHGLKKFCSDCTIERTRISKRKTGKKRNRILRQPQEYEDNFMRVVKEPFHLTTDGFNEVSKIKAQSYTNFFHKSWVEIVRMYNRLDDLESYVSNEYKLHIEDTGFQDLKNFAKNHKYISQAVIDDIGSDKIRENVGIHKLRYTKDELIKNMYKLKEAFGTPPLFNEFFENTNISFISYENHFLKDYESKKYDYLIKEIFTKEEYDDYKQRRSEHKIDIGRKSGSSRRVYSDEYLKEEFIRVFEYCKKEYGEYPSRRLFGELSKFDHRTYTKRFNLSWTEVCEMFGYKINKYANRAEKMVLNIIKDITGCECKPQAYFDWLRGDKGYHLFVDGYYEDLKLIIEFDGETHRQPIEAFGGEEMFKVLQRNDQIKNEIIPKKGIKLIRISSEEKWYDKEYMANKLINNDIPVLNFN